MKKSILGSLRFLIFSLIVFGGLYTVAVTGIGQLFFSDQANGSKVSVNNQVVGSKLIGQTFEQAKYFSGRSEEVSQLSPVSAAYRCRIGKKSSREKSSE